MGLHAGLRVAVDGDAVAGEADETDRTRLQPFHDARDARRAGAVLGRGDLLGRDRRALDEVGHADGVTQECVPWVTVARHDAGGERGRPEPVVRGDEADTGVGGAHARVEPAHEQPHRGAHEVGQRAGATREHVQPPVVAVALGHGLDDREARALEYRGDLVGHPPREEAPGEGVVGERAFAVTLDEGEVHRRVDGERLVELHERPRQPAPRDVQVARTRPPGAERAAPERQRLEVGAHPGDVGRSLPREDDHGARRVEGQSGTRQVREVQAGTAPEVGRDRAARGSGHRHRACEALDPIEEPRPSAVAPLLGARLVHRDGLLLHPRIIAA